MRSVPGLQVHWPPSAGLFQRDQLIKSHIVASLDSGRLQLLHLHVQRFVDSESPGLAEAFPTLLALEGLFFGMNVPAQGTEENCSHTPGSVNVAAMFKIV